VNRALDGAIIAGLSAALLYHFIRIWQHGKVYIYEPNRAVLLAETVGVGTLFGYGVYRVVKSSGGER